MQTNLKILLAVSALFNLAAGLFGPVYGIFVEQIGGDLLTTGASYSAYAIAAGVLIFLFGKWEDKVKHQEILIITGYMISSMGYFGYLFVKTPANLFAVQVIFGIGTAMSLPAFDSLYSKHLDTGKFASEWGTWESLSWIVTGIGALAGGFITKVYGFRLLFAMMFMLSSIGIIISLFLVLKRRFVR